LLEVILRPGYCRRRLDRRALGPRRQPAGRRYRAIARRAGGAAPGYASEAGRAVSGGGPPVALPGLGALPGEPGGVIPASAGWHSGRVDSGGGLRWLHTMGQCLLEPVVLVARSNAGRETSRITTPPDETRLPITADWLTKLLGCMMVMWCYNRNQADRCRRRMERAGRKGSEGTWVALRNARLQAGYGG
jgi:hypothetical protein